MYPAPSTTPSASAATTVRPGGPIIHIRRPLASVMPGSYAYVSRAATIWRKKGQIASQSSGRASRIVTCRGGSSAIDGHPPRPRPAHGFRLVRVDLRAGLLKLALGRDPHDVPREPHPRESRDEQPRKVELPPPQPVIGGPR